MGDTDADGAAVKWTGRAGEGGAESGRALSRELAAVKRTGQPREGGAERTDANAERATVKRNGRPREGGTEGARTFSRERVRPVGRVEEGGCSSRAMIVVDFAPVKRAR